MPVEDVKFILVVKLCMALKEINKNLNLILKLMDSQYVKKREQWSKFMLFGNEFGSIILYSAYPVDWRVIINHK